MKLIKLSSKNRDFREEKNNDYSIGEQRKQTNLIKPKEEQRSAETKRC